MPGASEMVDTPGAGTLGGLACGRPFDNPDDTAGGTVEDQANPSAESGSPHPEHPHVFVESQHGEGPAGNPNILAPAPRLEAKEGGSEGRPRLAEDVGRGSPRTGPCPSTTIDPSPAAAMGEPEPSLLHHCPQGEGVGDPPSPPAKHVGMISVVGDLDGCDSHTRQATLVSPISPLKGGDYGVCGDRPSRWSRHVFHFAQGSPKTLEEPAMGGTFDVASSSTSILGGGGG